MKLNKSCNKLLLNSIIKVVKWNIQIMLSPGYTQQLVHEIKLQKLDIRAISEMIWKIQGEYGVDFIIMEKLCENK